MGFNSGDSGDKHKRKRFFLILFFALLFIGVVSASYLGSSNFLRPQSGNPGEGSVSNSSGIVIMYQGETPFQLPEYGFGGSLIAMIACLATFVLYKKRKQLTGKSSS